MKILLDVMLPHALRGWLPEHEVFTAVYLKLNELPDGQLLQEAGDASFDVVITADQNLVKQQNLNNLSLSIILLRLPRLSVAHVEAVLPEIQKVLDQKMQRRVYEVIYPV